MSEPVRVLVPLHDGASTIAALLADLAEQVDVTVDLAVVANGCRDDSAAVARGAVDALGGMWRTAVVLELDAPGRTGALVAGESALAGDGPLVVCDQDVRVPPDALRVLVAALHPIGAAHLVTPALDLPDGLGGLALRYWRTWSRLPYVVDAPVSVGLYALSQEGRRRTGAWPERAPDDKHARGAVGARDCMRVTGTHYSVDLPATPRAIVVSRAGYLRANRRLRRSSPRVAADSGARGTGLVGALVGGSWVDAAAFVALYGAGALLELLQRVRPARRRRLGAA